MELKLIKKLYGTEAYNKIIVENKAMKNKHTLNMAKLRQCTGILKNGGTLLTPEEIKECEGLEND